MTETKPANLEEAPFKTRIQKECHELFSLGGPILIVQLLQVAVVAMDTIMSGRYSAKDLSGVAIGGSIWFPIFLFLFGILSALTPTVAQLHGAKRYHDIPANVFQSGWIALALAPITMSLIFLLDPLLLMIGADDDIRPISSGYLHAMKWGLPGVLLYNVLRFYSDGVSLTKPAVTASIVGLTVNAFLNYGLIYGKFGLPELGGIGCGWASAISFWVMFFYLLLTVKFKNAYKDFYLFDHFYGINIKKIKHLLHVGMPIGFANFVESSMFGVIALFLASLGAVTVAAHQIALNVSALVFMIPLSLSIALTVRIGFLIGAKSFHEARFTAFLGIAVAILYALVSASLLFWGRFHIAGFYTEDTLVIDLTAILLIYAALFQLGDALQVTAAGALRGYKDTHAAMLIMILTFWCFGLPLGYILGLTDWMGPARLAEGFWLGLVIGLILAGALLCARLLVLSKRFLNNSESIIQ